MVLLQFWFLGAVVVAAVILQNKDLTSVTVDLDGQINFVSNAVVIPLPNVDEYSRTEKMTFLIKNMPLIGGYINQVNLRNSSNQVVGNVLTCKINSYLIPVADNGLATFDLQDPLEIRQGNIQITVKFSSPIDSNLITNLRFTKT